MSPINQSPIERSEAQKAASRENGKASHGPVTAEGRARSSQNAIKHGLRSSRVVLCNEDPEHYDQLLNIYFNEWNPVGQTERDILVTMVNALWRKRRSQSTEKGAVNTEMFIQKTDVEAAVPGLTPDMRQADAVISISNANPSANDYFLRSEIRLERMYRTARKDLIEMQTMRLGQASKLDPQPEPNLPVQAKVQAQQNDSQDNTHDNTGKESTPLTYEPEACSNNFKEPEAFSFVLPFVPTAARPTNYRTDWTDAADPVPTDLAA